MLKGGEGRDLLYSGGGGEIGWGNALTRTLKTSSLGTMTASSGRAFQMTINGPGAEDELSVVSPGGLHLD